MNRPDHHVVEDLAEINDELLRLSARRAEIVKVLGSELDPDTITAQTPERVRDLASFLDSEDVNDQRKALFAFCEQIVADAEAREIVIHTDLLGLAQKRTPPGFPAGLLNPSLPERNPGSNSRANEMSALSPRLLRSPHRQSAVLTRSSTSARALSRSQP